MSDFSKEATFVTITRQAHEIERLQARLAESEASTERLGAIIDAMMVTDEAKAARLAEADKLIDEAAQDRAMTFTPWRVKVRAYHKRYLYIERPTVSADEVQHER